MNIAFLLNTENGYRMYNLEGEVVEEQFTPMVQQSSKQVGIYEYVDLTDESYAYIFKVRVLIEEPFNEGDYYTLFDFLADYYEENFDEDEDDE